MASNSISEMHNQNGTSGSSNSCVAILLTTYNGERFLCEQLDSIAAQTHRDWVVYVSDDGSADGTLKILERYQASWGSSRMQILQGPCRGFAANFMSLVRNARIDAPYLAFCDQDDVWFSDKLKRALAALEKARDGEPALFCSRTRLVDEDGNILGFSPAFRKGPSFRNALVQSIAGANTMVFNRAVRNLLSLVKPDAMVVSHDWLTYLLVAGCDGRVVYDLAPTLDYRQHGRNLVGTNTGFVSQLKRAREMLHGTFRVWNQSNLDAIEPMATRFSSQNQEILRLFEQARDRRLLARLGMLLKARVHHQAPMGNAGLLVAAILRKM